MRKFKILFLMSIGIFCLNSCATLVTAGAVAYFCPQLVEYTCADYQGQGLCKIFETPEETSEQKAKRKEKEEKKYREKREKYVQKLISQKRKNQKLLENIIISLPKDLEFRKETENTKASFGNILFRLYDEKNENEFFYLYIVERRENSQKDFEKIINGERNENYENYYKKLSEENIKNWIQEYEEDLSKEQTNLMKNYYGERLKEYKEKLKKGFNITTEVRKINENIYVINEKINDFGDLKNNITYVKILKDGVYVVADELDKDIFLALFGK